MDHGPGGRTGGRRGHRAPLPAHRQPRPAPSRLRIRPSGAGRNIGLGPNYFSLDLRFSQTFRLREKVNLQLLAESFNLTNRTNYASVNNIVSSNLTNFNVSGSAAIAPTAPLGFTSAYPKREFQLGFRLDF